MRATILLMPTSLRRMFVIITAEKKEVIEVIKTTLPVFERTKTMELGFYRGGGDGMELVAEEAFDLTNNPSRQDERELIYGRGRSLSVGDVVEVEDPNNPETVHHYLCCSTGWAKLEG